MGHGSSVSRLAGKALPSGQVGPLGLAAPLTSGCAWSREVASSSQMCPRWDSSAPHWAVGTAVSGFGDTAEADTVTVQGGT